LGGTFQSCDLSNYSVNRNVQANSDKSEFKGKEMDIKTLIDTAAKTCSITQAQLAAEMGKNPARVSEWRKGHWNPDVNEIAYLADKAGLPVLQTVIELQANLNPKYANIWKRAVSELRQNQGLSRWVDRRKKRRSGAFLMGSAKGQAPACYRRRAGDRGASF
jgi:hypothetical protein